MKKSTVEPALVDSLGEVIENARRFQKIFLPKYLNCKALERFSRFSHWYYLPDLEIFAPSKFIGYKNTSIKKYDGTGNGGETEIRLTKWFVKVPKKSQDFTILSTELERFAAKLDKKISEKTYKLEGKGAIHILKDALTIDYDPFELNEEKYEEGKLLIRLHKKRERNAKLIKDAKRMAKNLDCICCGLNFEKQYGDLGSGFIEAHHTVPISQANETGRKAEINDIALVCSNCHRMIHRVIQRNNRWPTKQELANGLLRFARNDRE